MSMEKKTVKGTVDLGNGFTQIDFTDGSFVIGMFSTLIEDKTANTNKTEAEKPEVTSAKKEDKKALKKKIDVPEDWDELDELDEDELKALAKQEDIDLDEDEDEDDWKKVIAEDLDIEIPKKGKGDKKAPKEEAEEAEEDLTWDDLADMDSEELADLIDEEELKVDPDDFEDDEDGLRKAVAKALKIEVPKKKKK